MSITKTLNLVNINKSDIKYKIHNFPDGHKHIELLNEFNKCSYVEITCRICNGDDLFILLQLHDIFTVNEIKITKLHIVYLLAARCDRRFSIGEALDIKIIMQLLNTIVDTKAKNEYAISILDVHSDKVEDYSNLWANYHAITKFDYSKYRICFPDKGAKDRLFPRILYWHELSDFTRHCGRVKPIICEKHRFDGGMTNGIPSINKRKNSRYFKKPILVVDDLCDGGTTFVNTHKLLKDRGHKKISLFVTHAIQFEGIKRVAEVYDEVFITNSFRSWHTIGNDLPDNVTVIEL